MSKVSNKELLAKLRKRRELCLQEIDLLNRIDTRDARAEAEAYDIEVDGLDAEIEELIDYINERAI